MTRHSRFRRFAGTGAFMALVSLLTGITESQAAYPGKNGEITFVQGSALRLIGADGSGARPLGPSGEHPAWSPDGTRLAFSTPYNGQNTNADIYVVDANGSNLRRLTTDPASDSDPVWSPDGRRIAFVSTYGESGGLNSGKIWIMNADGSGAYRLTGRADEGPEGQPAWSSDGYVAYTQWEPVAMSEYGGRQSDVWMRQVDGGQSSERLTSTGRASSPDFSPDSLHMAYVNAANGRSQIWVHNWPKFDQFRPMPRPRLRSASFGPQAVGEQRDEPLVSSQSEDTDPAWSPDGTKVAFARDGKVHVYDFTTARPVVSQDQTVAGRDLNWRPVHPAIAVSPVSLEFGKQSTEASSAPKKVTVRSTGNGPLAVSSVTVGGGHAADFVKSTDACSGKTLAPGASCDVTLRFVPRGGGARSASLSVTSDAPGAPQVALRGVGDVPSRPQPPTDPDSPNDTVGPTSDTSGPQPPVGPPRPGAPQLSLVPDRADFGPQPIGTSSEPKSFTARNSGKGTLRITRVSLGLPDGTEFDVSIDACTGLPLTAGQGCQISVRFSPGAVGIKRSWLDVTSNATRNPLRAGLSGEATKAPEIPVPMVVVEPAIGPPGFVAAARGAGFPPNVEVVLTWEPGLGQQRVTTDAQGAFVTSVMVMPRDQLGRRALVATVLNAISPGARADFLVVPASLQPSSRRTIRLTTRS